MQVTANYTVMLAEYNRRRKLIKSTCEKYGAYKSREKVRAKMLLDGADLRPGVENDEQLWTLLKRYTQITSIKPILSSRVLCTFEMVL